MRNHQAVIDPANGTINFPHVEMTLAMTDEMKKCNPKPLQIMAEGNQTLPPQQTTTVNAIVITTNMHDVTGAVQPLPQFDETATIIVAPALATAHNKRLNIRIANLTDFPHTIKNHTKLAELQILKPEDTKQIRPVDAAALKLLEDPDDTHMYINELMKSNEHEQSDENLWFPTPENPGNEEEHTPIQRRILKEIRELIQKENLDPTKDPESRQKFLDMFQWEGSQIEGNDRKQLEQTIIEYNDIFARHRLDIGINNSFKVKLTPKRRASDLHAKFAGTNQFERRPNSRIGANAQVRHNNDPTIFKVCKPNFRTEETKWQIASTCRPAKNKRTNLRRLHQQ